jgi:DNA-binding NarL/FixJ family response regulator
MHNGVDNEVQRNLSLESRLGGTHASVEGINPRDVLPPSKDNSTEADVIERLLFLATSIAVNSNEQSLLQGFTGLLRSLIEAIEGDEFASAKVAFHLPSRVADAKKRRRTALILTVRQREVLRLRSTGLGVATIAERLNLSVGTVHSHIRDAVERLGVSGGAMAAVAEARMLGLI